MSRHTLLALSIVAGLLILLAIWMNSRRPEAERGLDLPTLILLLAGVFAFWLWILLRAG